MKELVTAWIRLWACLGSHTEKCMLPVSAEHEKPLHSSCKLVCRIKAARYYATATKLREVKLHTKNWEFKFSAKNKTSVSRTAKLLSLLWKHHEYCEVVHAASIFQPHLWIIQLFVALLKYEVCLPCWPHSLKSFPVTQVVILQSLQSLHDNMNLWGNFGPSPLLSSLRYTPSCTSKVCCLRWYTTIGRQFTTWLEIKRF